MGSNLPISKTILFDGVCNLCSASVQFVIRHDHKQVFQFASLQSDFARQALPDLESTTDYKTFVLIKEGRIFLRSNAALEVARDLNGLWPILYVFKIVPRFIRDAVYDFISRNRYRWFGRKDACWIPTPELRARFIG